MLDASTWISFFDDVQELADAAIVAAHNFCDAVRKAPAPNRNPEAPEEFIQSTLSEFCELSNEVVAYKLETAYVDVDFVKICELANAASLRPIRFDGHSFTTAQPAAYAIVSLIHSAFPYRVTDGWALPGNANPTYLQKVRACWDLVKVCELFTWELCLQLQEQIKTETVVAQTWIATGNCLPLGQHDGGAQAAGIASSAAVKTPIVHPPAQTADSPPANKKRRSRGRGKVPIGDKLKLLEQCEKAVEDGEFVNEARFIEDQVLKGLMSQSKGRQWLSDARKHRESSKQFER